MPVKDLQAFQDLLDLGERKFEHDYLFARALKLSTSTYSRLKNGKVGLGVEKCLRLAGILHRPAGEVLRTAGHTRIADLLDQVTTPTTNAALMIDDEEMAAVWKRLNSPDRELLRDNAKRYLLTYPPAPSRKSPAPTKAPAPKGAQLKR